MGDHHAKLKNHKLRQHPRRLVSHIAAEHIFNGFPIKHDLACTIAQNINFTKLYKTTKEKCILFSNHRAILLPIEGSFSWYIQGECLSVMQKSVWDSSSLWAVYDLRFNWAFYSLYKASLKLNSCSISFLFIWPRCIQILHIGQHSVSK